MPPPGGTQSLGSGPGSISLFRSDVRLRPINRGGAKGLAPSTAREISMSRPRGTQSFASALRSQSLPNSDAIRFRPDSGCGANRRHLDTPGAKGLAPSRGDEMQIPRLGGTQSLASALRSGCLFSFDARDFLAGSALHADAGVEPKEKDIAYQCAHDAEQAQHHQHRPGQIHVFTHQCSQHQRTHGR